MSRVSIDNIGSVTGKIKRSRNSCYFKIVYKLLHFVQIIHKWGTLIMNTYIQNREANKSSKRRDSVQNGVKTLFYHWKRQKSNIISYSPSSPYPFLNIINHSSSNFLSILYSLINRFTFNSQFQLIIINETPSHFDVSTIDQTTQRIILSYPLDNVRTFIRWNS